MSQGICITGTGTDVGKTYVTALLIKKMRQAGLNAGYYKAALSGATCLSDSDAGYVNRIAAIGQAEHTLVSYLYPQSVSPHLAAKLENNPPSIEQIRRDYKRVSETYPYVLVEGSGGIVCPIRYDAEKQILLEDIIRDLALSTLIVADAGLGTINSTVLTVSYLRERQLPLIGIILNNYTDSTMHQDNRFMITELTGIPVITCVEPDANEISLSRNELVDLFENGGLEQ